MSNRNLIANVCRYAQQKGAVGGYFETDLPGLYAMVCPDPTKFECYVYDVVVCLILQGRKETVLGGRTVEAGAGDTVIVSHDLAVASRIIEASPKEPYVALVLTVDLSIVRNLFEQLENAETEAAPATAYEVSLADVALIEAIERYVTLIENPNDMKIMAPLLLKEIHYRLLMAPHGGMLRKLLNRNSHASRISKSIELIRQNFAKPMSVADLAETAGMSTSSFHEHFKSITALSPIQYQKELRLVEARRLLLEGQYSVSSTAYEIGYESPTQFSREYTRKFGVSPRTDLRDRYSSEQ